jgi:stage II sporulation protein AA (anti-sigma F factor antagonist)
MSQSQVLSAAPAPGLFELQEREIWPGCLEVEVTGELDLAVSDRLRAALGRAAVNDLHVLVDLSACEFIDASGVAVLVRGNERLRDRDCQLLLFGARAQVRRVLSVTGLAGANHGTAEIRRGWWQPTHADGAFAAPIDAHDRPKQARQREEAYPASRV